MRLLRDGMRDRERPVLDFAAGCDVTRVGWCGGGRNLGSVFVRILEANQLFWIFTANKRIFVIESFTVLRASGKLAL